MHETILTEQPSTGTSPNQSALDFYLRALDALNRAGVEYLVGGGYAFAHYTRITRHTKDLDIFVRPGASRQALDTLAAAGYRTEWTWPHFLGKALSDGDAFIDVLYNSGNGLTPVDEAWFEHAVEGEFLGTRVLLVPPEEMIWSKAFVQERARFDGADVLHILLHRASALDWQRLTRRFQGHEAVLLGHLLLFGYVYPTERQQVPSAVLDELWARIRAEPAIEQRICRGTNLAPHEYRPDVEQWSFVDARRQPFGPLRLDDIARFTPPDAQPIR